MLEPYQYGLGALSGSIVGFSLGLIGGGGSILAVPLMVYLVGVRNPHVAIGTSALAVALNAAVGLISHARAGTVKWRCGATYAAAGVAGALAGSLLGKAVDGQRLLVLFALLMIAVGILMLRRSGYQSANGSDLDRSNVVKVATFGLGTGVLSGFFGIGGGFLIVPGLVASVRLPMIYAVGTSLVAVTAFGATTALSYAASGLVNWPLAGAFVIGGVAGSVCGVKAAGFLAKRDSLTKAFACLIFAVAGYVLLKAYFR